VGILQGDILDTIASLEPKAKAAANAELAAFELEARSPAHKTVDSLQLSATIVSWTCCESVVHDRPVSRFEQSATVGISHMLLLQALQTCSS
jgi:hypothetical protein